MDIISSVEASLYKYLFETVPAGVKVFEDVIYEDFQAHNQWIVIDSLTNKLGAQPVQQYFIHVAQQKNEPNSKATITKLASDIYKLIDEGTTIDLYDIDSVELIGSMRVVSTSFSPVLQHRGGGSMRSISIGVAYPALS